ncbi:amidohydrolase family protein [Vineibacter terrae]|uniref:amidohydrolase family protein n=1 Tax=Vineibacter terrae TaxID=2586908 RepID=UPI002E356161|nr:amidohydrolase family protein [Vineibacter terrae]HEX2889554.1 amidohydrolase family protein [Vineibacter terrae]
MQTAWKEDAEDDQGRTARQVIMTAADKVFLASADGHVGAPTEVYRKYLESRYFTAFDEYLAYHKWLWSPAHPESLLEPALHDRMRTTAGFDPARGSPIVWDAAFRLQEYDREGIVAEVLVPDDQNSNDPPFGSGLATAAVAGSGYESYSPEWQRIGARAYNRWLADFCSTDRKRLLGLTILGTLDDVDWAVNEIIRAYDAGLRTGVLLPLEYYLPLYHHPRYDPLWAVLQELDLSVVCHISKGGPQWVGSEPWVISRIWSLEARWFAQRPLWCLIFGGVLERFPKLRLVFTEFGTHWVAPLLDQMDKYAEEDHAVFSDSPRKVKLSMTPSAYFRRQCFIAYSGLINREDLEGDAFGAVPNLLWGADLGHGEGIWPSGLDNLRTLVGGLPERAMRGYLGEEIHRAFPVRKSEFTALIDRIAPTADRLGLVA